MQAPTNETITLTHAELSKYGSSSAIAVIGIFIVMGGLIFSLKSFLKKDKVGVVQGVFVAIIGAVVFFVGIKRSPDLTNRFQTAGTPNTPTI